MTRWTRQVGGRGFLPMHRAIGSSMMLFGVGVGLNPAFPYQGVLLRLHPWVPYVYATLFIIGGGGLFRHRPRPLHYLILSAPLFTHLVGVIIDIMLTSLAQLLPISALYGLLLVMFVKIYWHNEGDVYG